MEVEVIFSPFLHLVYCATVYRWSSTSPASGDHHLFSWIVIQSHNKCQTGILEIKLPYCGRGPFFPVKVAWMECCLHYFWAILYSAVCAFISFVLTEFSHYLYSDRSGTGVGDENRMPHLYPDALDTVRMDDLIKDYLSSKDNVWSLCTQKTTQHWLAQGFMQVFCTFFCAFLVVKTPKGKMCLVLIVKPWTNGLTSEHKFLTCIHLCFMWPTTCLDLQWLVLTLAEFRFMCNSMHDFQHLATQHK